ncbi:MAG: phosphoglycerate dehydrogenase, partial [Pseudarcicella sp.]|nr:phosphoglycerate dehydrogenase [Pseudarcicella sp.]
QPNIKREGILAIIADFDGLVIRSKTQIDKCFLEKAIRLKFIARAGAGLDLIDLKLADEHNIQVFAANEGNKDAVAEHVLGMILCLLNHINWSDQEVRNGIWLREENRGVELKGMTVGILGYGNMGRALAQRLRSFGVEILAYDIDENIVFEDFVRKSTLENIYEKTDILSIHLPLNSETKLLFDDQYLQNFKKNIFVVNSSRGEIVSLATIKEGLVAGKIRGACLDVLEKEKFALLTDFEQKLYQELFSFKNTLFTPHVAGWTQESYVKINDVLFSKIQSFLKN